MARTSNAAYLVFPPDAHHPATAPLDLWCGDPDADTSHGYAYWVGTDWALGRPRPTYVLTINGTTLPVRYIHDGPCLIAGAVPVSLRDRARAFARWGRLVGTSTHAQEEHHGPISNP